MPQTTLEQTMRIAIGHHQAGRLDRAEAIYRAVLAQCPEHAAALHLLGVLAGQMGRIDPAINLISRAIAIDPGGRDVSRQSGRDLSQIGSVGTGDRFVSDRAIELKPDHAEGAQQPGQRPVGKGSARRGTRRCTAVPSRSSPIMPRRTATWATS